MDSERSEGNIGERRPQAQNVQSLDVSVEE